MPNTASDNPALDALITRHGLRRGRDKAVQPARASGHIELDACLPGGGLPRGALTEILPQPAGGGELALLLALLARRTQAGDRVAFIDAPCPLYAPALARAGLRLDRVLTVQAGEAAANLWAAEQLMGSPLFGAVLCWSPATPKALRRLQIAAETGGGVAVLYRSERDAALSVAALRLAVKPAGGGVEVSVRKCRGPSGAQVRCPLGGAQQEPPAAGNEGDDYVAVPAPAALRA